MAEVLDVGGAGGLDELTRGLLFSGEEVQESERVLRFARRDVAVAQKPAERNLFSLIFFFVGKK